MATTFDTRIDSRSDERFFLISAWVMAAVIVAGFSVSLAFGRSSFSLPWVFHVHAFIFFGWVALYLTQTALASTGSIALHRRLGWLAVVWVPAMLAMGTLMTVISVTRGAPFFFDAREFLFGNPAQLLAFGGLVAAAISVRRRTGAHRRLMYCGMAILTGPGFGRLLPMPFLIPWAWWACFAAVMLFPLAGIIADLRRSGRVHPAWWWGVAAMCTAQVTGDLIAFSPIGGSVTHSLIDGTPGGARPITAHFP